MDLYAESQGTREHHRALYQFFGPFMPVGVLVAEEQLNRAEGMALDLEREVPPLVGSEKG